MKQHPHQAGMGQGDCQFGPRLSKPQRVRACTALQFNKVARVLFGLLRFGEPRCGSDSIHLVASPLVFLWLVCLIPLLVSCETQPHLVLDTVGPPSASVGSSGLDFAGIGFLRVYSATETRNADKFITYYPHTPYTIYTTNGQLFRWERNSVTTADENPALVRLPSGLYTVRAQDDGYGRVIVPVLIKGGETTTIHLDARRLAPTEHLNPTNAVRLPNGRLVGWRAREPMGPSGL